MPWCEPCARYLAAPTVRPDGTCPQCSHPVMPTAPAEVKPRLPWHFKLLVTATGAYLALRLAQGVQWAIQHLR